MFDKPVMSDPTRQPIQGDKKFHSSTSPTPAARRLAQAQRAERERMDRFGRFGGR